jgi:membrane protease subunit HflK
VAREGLMLTDDENIVDIQFAVQYLVKDPEDYLFNVRRPDQVVMQVAESGMREIVGKSSMDFVLYEGREQIAASAQKLMQDILDRYKTGVSISRVTMQNAQPPEQVQAAFDDAVKAKQDLERQKSEGQAYYNDVVPKARGAASRLTEEANGYRQRVVANAEGEAARFRSVLVEYNKAPAVTRERLYLETMQQIMTSTSKILIDARSGGNLLMLPLDKLLQMPATGAGEGLAGARPAESAVVPEAPGRARDSLRSRDREGRP